MSGTVEISEAAETLLLFLSECAVAALAVVSEAAGTEGEIDTVLS